MFSSFIRATQTRTNSLQHKVRLNESMNQICVVLYSTYVIYVSSYLPNVLRQAADHVGFSPDVSTNLSKLLSFRSKARYCCRVLEDDMGTEGSNYCNADKLERKERSECFHVCFLFHLTRLPHCFCSHNVVVCRQSRATHLREWPQVGDVEPSNSQSPHKSCKNSMSTLSLSSPRRFFWGVF